jgi:multicomponent Na+:H+ antiporter subunit G
MMETLLEVIIWILLGAGSFFYVVGALGLMRMPDVFTRMHATSVSDTFGALLLLVAMILKAGLTLVTFKLAITLAILLYTGPVATHALARAARHAGVDPLLDKDDNKEGAKSKSE